MEFLAVDINHQPASLLECSDCKCILRVEGVSEHIDWHLSIRPPVDKAWDIQDRISGKKVGD